MSSTTNNGKVVTQWQCPECHKYLSSKRSYREHMNVHGKVRPFQCEKCNYAAASQMTLRRHRLRSHIPRQDWGYPCPYCSEIYMEPASYQQHVSHRHFGLSCTFGCPHKSCNFTSKCTKSFLEHVSKHLVIVPENDNDEFKTENPSNINPVKYLIDDEIGSGYGKPPRKAHIQRYPDVLSLTTDKNGRSKVSVPVNTKPVEKKTRPSRIKTIDESMLIDTDSVETTSISNLDTEIIAENDEYSQETNTEFKEETEIIQEEPQYFQLVDENGETLDGQLYYYAYDADGNQFLATASDFEYVESVEPIETNKDSEIIKNNKEERRLPDGQVDIDLD